MDALIKRFDAVEDRDLMLCLDRGVAYQRAVEPIAYDEGYFDHYAALEGNAIARALNAARSGLVNRHVGPERTVLDVGVGSGEFVASRPNTSGHDINPKAIEWLKARGRWAENLMGFDAYTFWDVLEHVPSPNVYFKRMPEGAYLFTSLPIFGDLKTVRQSKHYKPNEHLYYFTERGFVDWMAAYRFRLLERNDFETVAGRENILSFAFVRDLPDYRTTVGQYRKMHENCYGASAYLYFDQIAREVLGLNPASLLDFGCGRSDLVAHFWKDGQRRVCKFDPAIPQYEQMPADEFDLVLCTDVMEHIQLADIDRVLSEIRRKSAKALFTISMRPARAKLPDGRNAHVSLLTANEWLRWIADHFGMAKRLPTQWDHILMVKTF